MVRLLILICIVVTSVYVDIRLLYGILIGLVYTIVCNIIDERRDRGDC